MPLLLATAYGIVNKVCVDRVQKKWMLYMFSHIQFA